MRDIRVQLLVARKLMRVERSTSCARSIVVTGRSGESERGPTDFNVIYAVQQLRYSIPVFRQRTAKWLCVYRPDCQKVENEASVRAGAVMHEMALIEA